MATGLKSSFVWTFGERFVAQLVSTIVSVILARLLTPDHYGAISIVMVFIALCEIFTNSGMGRSIVRKENVDECDYNTAFLIGLAIAAVAFALVMITSPFIAHFYKIPELTVVLRVMGLRLPVGAINTIQLARVQREMRFKSYFASTLFATVISGALGICMAYSGMGIWALVAQYMSGTLISTIVLMFMDHWIPRLQFSIEKAKEIFNFGWKVLATDLVFTLQTDIRSLIIGKVFGASDLAYFDQGKKYPYFLVDNINKAINTVMLPAFSRVQDQYDQLKRMLSKSISVGSYILVPILLGFAAVSDSFVVVVLTEKWIACVPYIKLFCLMLLTRPLETSCHQALLALGDSGRVLKIMIRINIVGLLGVLIASFVFHSVLLIAVSSLVSTLVSVFCFMHSMAKKIGYSWKEQLNDIGPTLFIGSIMYGCVALVRLTAFEPLVMLVMQIIVGFITYLICSAVFRIKPFGYLLSMIAAKCRK